MKKQLYFEDIDSNICRSEEYFQNIMKRDGLQEMKVLEAFPYREEGLFWCYIAHEVADKSDQPCGKECNHYEPRNGKSGCCKHYTRQFYHHGDEVTLARK